MRLRQAKKIWKKGMPVSLSWRLIRYGCSVPFGLVYPTAKFNRAQYRYKKTWSDRDWATIPSSPSDEAISRLFHCIAIDKDDS